MALPGNPNGFRGALRSRQAKNMPIRNSARHPTTAALCMHLVPPGLLLWMDFAISFSTLLCRTLLFICVSVVSILDLSSGATTYRCWVFHSTFPSRLSSVEHDDVATFHVDGYRSHHLHDRSPLRFRNRSDSRCAPAHRHSRGHAELSPRGSKCHPREERNGPDGLEGEEEKPQKRSGPSVCEACVSPIDGCEQSGGMTCFVQPIGITCIVG